MNQCIKDEIWRALGRRYEWIQELQSVDINCQMSAIELQETICNNESTHIEEERKFECRIYQNDVIVDPEIEGYFSKKREYSSVDAKKWWQAEPTFFRRELGRWESEDPKGFAELKRPFIERIENSWAGEVERRCSGNTHWLKSSRAASIKNIVHEYGGSGFVQDKKSLVHGSISFSKEIFPGARLVWTIDKKSLNNPILPEAAEKSSGVSIKPGPSIQILLMLSFDDDQFGSIKRITVDHFLPLHIRPLSGNYYRKFFSDEEMLALVTCIMDCLRLIEAQLVKT